MGQKPEDESKNICRSPEANPLERLHYIRIEELHRMRAYCNEVQERSTTFVDKAVITTSLGALTLSITWTEKNTIQSCYHYLLIFAWMTLGGSFISTIVSAFTSQKEHNELVTNLDKQIDSEYRALQGIDHESTSSECRIGSLKNVTSRLNVISVFLLILGLFILALVKVNSSVSN